MAEPAPPVAAPDDRPDEERDELEDRLADQRRQELGWLVQPMTDEGYW